MNDKNLYSSLSGTLVVVALAAFCVGAFLIHPVFGWFCVGGSCAALAFAYHEAASKL